MNNCPYCKSLKIGVQKSNVFSLAHFYEYNKKEYKLFCFNCGAMGPVCNSLKQAIKIWKNQYKNQSNKVDEVRCPYCLNKTKWTEQIINHDWHELRCDSCGSITPMRNSLEESKDFWKTDADLSIHLAKKKKDNNKIKNIKEFVYILFWIFIGLLSCCAFFFIALSASK